MIFATMMPGPGESVCCADSRLCEIIATTNRLRHSKVFLLALITVHTTTSPTLSRPTHLTDFDPTAQNARHREYTFPKSKLTVMTVANHKVSEQLEPWIQQLQDRYGKFLRMLEGMEGKQPGDPAKAAEAIMSAVASESPPLRLVLGKYAQDKVRRKLAGTASELNVWETVGLQTSFSNTP